MIEESSLKMNQEASNCKSQQIYKNDGLTISFLLFFTTAFCCLTGVEMGYDLCLTSSILEPIKNDFRLCPEQIIQPTSLYTEELLFSSLVEDEINSTTRQTLTSVSQPLTTPELSTTRRLQPSPCFSKQHRSLGVNSNGDGNGRRKFHSCVPKEICVSILSPGAAAGSLLAGILADEAGRKPTLFTSNFLTMAGTFIMASAPTFAVLLVGRLILGCGIGMGFVIFSTYISEVAPDRLRGCFVSSIEVAQCVGCLLSFAVTAIWGNEHWRWLLTAVGIIAAIQLFGIFFLPESPRWFVRKNQLLKAQNSLRKLAGISTKGREAMREKNTTSSICLETCESVATPDKAEFNRQKTKRKQIEIELAMNKMIDESNKEQRRKKKEDFMKGNDYTSEQQNEFKKKLYRRESSQKTSADSQEHREDEEDLINDEEKWNENENELLSPFRIKDNDSLNITDIENNKNNGLNQRCYLSSLFYGCSCRTMLQDCQKHYHQIFIAVGCAVCQNLTASTAVLYYSAELFQLGGVNPFIPGVGIGLAKVFGILSLLFFVERVGRRHFLLIGSFGLLICHLSFAVCYGIVQFIDMKVCSMLVVTIMMLFMLCQNISWAGLMFVVSSEVLPSSVRGIGMGATIFIFWTLAFVTQSTFETLMEILSIAGVFLLYTITTFFALVFTYLYIPDLSGHSLEEITKRFEERKQRRKQIRQSDCNRDVGNCNNKNSNCQAAANMT